MARKKKSAISDLTGRPNDPVVQSGEDTLDPMSSDQTLAWLIRQFNESADVTQCSRREAEIYRDYYDGKQWSDKELQVLEARKQPAVTDNRIKDKIDYTLGLERKQRTDPKALARHPDDDPAADAVTAALRYVADCNQFPQVKSKVFGNMNIEGFGGAEVIADNATYTGTPNKKILIRYIRWDRLFYDAHSMLDDFSDARYMGIIKWMDLDEAISTYKGSKVAKDYRGFGQNYELFTSESFVAGFPTYDDRPRWFDRGRKRVQIVEHYYKKGTDWYRAVYTRVGFIEEPKKSVYLDAETQETVCPIILQALYVDREGNRYGAVKRYKDLQDEINKRRSKSLHLLSVNQALAEKGAVDDVEAARKELARPDGFVEYTPGMKMEVRENADLAEGQFKLLQEAQIALSATGPNEALLGTTGDISGRAKQLDQQGGLITLGIQGDSIRFWQKRIMTATFSRMKQFMTGEQFIRITDGDNAKYQPLNSTYPDNHPQVKAGKAQPGAPMNVLPEMEMDIIIDEAPDVATVQQEDFQSLVSLADGKVPIPPQALIEASGLSAATKKKVLDTMTGHLPDGTEIPPQVQQQIQQAQAQIQQISQAQQQKAQEQQQTEQQLQQAKAEALLQQTKAQAALDKIKAQQDAFELQFAARQQELTAQMEMLNAKEIELKALQLIAAQNLEATQKAAQQVVDGASKEAAITALTTKLETQQSEHKKQVSDLAIQHNQQLHQEREKARAAQSQANDAEASAKPEKPEKPAKPRKVTIERDATGRISGATIN